MIDYMTVAESHSKADRLGGSASAINALISKILQEYAYCKLCAANYSDWAKQAIAEGDYRRASLYSLEAARYAARADGIEHILKFSEIDELYQALVVAPAD